ncbi:hypothetical protein [Actinomadura napierensis]|uniref:hypothetical protein n=1 Tax=Actinomadura napierensis TaxID=267854 RepID=UPI0031E29184
MRLLFVVQALQLGAVLGDASGESGQAGRLIDLDGSAVRAGHLRLRGPANPSGWRRSSTHAAARQSGGATSSTSWPVAGSR